MAGTFAPRRERPDLLSRLLGTYGILGWAVSTCMGRDQTTRTRLLSLGWRVIHLWHNEMSRPRGLKSRIHDLAENLVGRAQ